MVDKVVWILIKEASFQSRVATRWPNKEGMETFLQLLRGMTTGGKFFDG